MSVKHENNYNGDIKLNCQYSVLLLKKEKGREGNAKKQ